MPYKPPKPCGYRNCPELTRGRYCDVHAKLETQWYGKYERDPKTNKRYGWTWKKIRAAFIKKNPLCVLCNCKGKLTLATTVHHKKKLADGGTHEYSNLMSLCASCHSSLHVEQGDYF
jgi:5-methylcytosine-specific restriction protein A